MTAPWVLSQVQVLAEAVATIAFALSGVIEGARKRLGAVGICVVGGLAAFGGGTVHDVLLDRHPLFSRATSLQRLWTFKSPAMTALCQDATLVARTLGVASYRDADSGVGFVDGASARGAPLGLIPSRGNQQ